MSITERWLVSYADFITLLFAFFVVLYASSQVDKRKVGKICYGDSGRLSGDGGFSGVDDSRPCGRLLPMPFSSVQAIENVERTASLARIGLSPRGRHSAAALKMATWRKLQTELEGTLAAEI